MFGREYLEELFHSTKAVNKEHGWPDSKPVDACNTRSIIVRVDNLLADVNTAPPKNYSYSQKKHNITREHTREEKMYVTNHINFEVIIVL